VCQVSFRSDISFLRYCAETKKLMPGQHSSYYKPSMLNDKLVILTYKNTIYQSKLKLLAIFVTILVCKQHTCFKPIPHVCSSSYRGGVILIDLN
jgi:hypothetical protein